MLSIQYIKSEGKQVNHKIRLKKEKKKMGGANGKLSQKKVKKLSEKTGFTRDEIVTWYSGFLSDCPSGKLTKKEFTKVYSGFFPHGDSKAFSE
jgi:hypothetical protein